MSLFSRDRAKAVLQKTGLYPAASAAYRLIYFYSGLLTVRHDDIAQIRNGLGFLEPRSVVDFHKIRVGAEYDGGYVMLDDFVGISMALSLGIGWDTTWDNSIAERNIPVLQFDHTIETAPISHKLCKFLQRKIVASQPANASEITIAGILLENNIGKAGDLFLKIDIDGAEWEVFSALDDGIVGQFRQILCEFHGFYRIGQIAWRRRAFRVFEKLSRSHCVLHVHGNNYRGLIHVGDVTVPEVLEVTFVRRKDYCICELKGPIPD